MDLKRILMILDLLIELSGDDWEISISKKNKLTMLYNGKIYGNHIDGENELLSEMGRWLIVEIKKVLLK